VEDEHFTFTSGVGSMPLWVVMVLIVVVAASIAPLVIAIVGLERVISFVVGGGSEK
jgi:hypothetical protein